MAPVQRQVSAGCLGTLDLPRVMGVGSWTPTAASGVHLQPRVEKTPRVASADPCPLRVRAGLWPVVLITQ